MPPKKTKTKNEFLANSSSYYSDMYDDQMYYAAIIRSPIDKGTIRSIVCNDIDENSRLITYKDIPGINKINFLSVEMPILAFQNISYIGEPIAIVLSPDQETAHYLAMNADIRYTQSFEEEKTSAVNNDMIMAHRVVKYGDSDTAFDTSELKIEQTFDFKLQTSDTCIEDTGAFVVPKKDSLEIYCPTNWPANVKQCISKATNIIPQNIYLQRTKTQDCSTIRLLLTTQLVCQAAIAALMTNKAVKIVLSKNEQNNFVYNPLRTRIRFRSSTNTTGVITAMNISISMNAGVFNPFVSEILDRLVIAAIGIYNPQNFLIEATALKSQASPSNADFRRLDVHIFAALESHMQSIAPLAGVTPLELRIKNITSPCADRPFMIEISKAITVLEAVAKTSDFNRKYASYYIHSQDQLKWCDSDKLLDPLRGIGLASAFNGNYYYGSVLDFSKQTIELMIDIDGTITIFSDPVSSSIKQIWTKIASKILNVDEKLIHFSQPERADDNENVSNTLFGNVGIMTSLLKKACTAIQKQRFRQPLPIKIKRVATISKKNNWDENDFTGNPFYDTSFGAAVMEIELDPFTFKESIRGVWIAIDAGEILDAIHAEQTIRRSVERVLSSLSENELTSDNIKIVFADSNENPKNIHNIVDNIIPAAYLSAITQAVRKPITLLPLSSNTTYKTGFTQKISGENQE